MIDPPALVETTAQQAAVVHVTIPREQIREAMGTGIRDLMAGIAGQGIKPSGPWFAHHLRMDPGTFDFEIGVPIPSPVTPSGRVKPGRLRAATVARTVYHGPYEGLHAAWGEFDAWVKENGHQAAGDLWEVYLSGPDSSPDPANWRTELNRPLIR